MNSRIKNFLVILLFAAVFSLALVAPANASSNYSFNSFSFGKSFSYSYRQDSAVNWSSHLITASNKWNNIGANIYKVASNGRVRISSKPVHGANWSGASYANGVMELNDLTGEIYRTGTAMHEFGHFLGLGDVYVSTEIMYAYATTRTTLGNGDIVGFRALYGGGAGCVWNGSYWDCPSSIPKEEVDY